MLGDISVVTELYVVCGYTDMRKSIDGLCTIIRDQLHMEPESGTSFIWNQIILLPCTCSVESGVTGSRHFCTSRYPQTFVIRTFRTMIVDNTELSSVHYARNMRIKNHLKPQILAISSSLSGHSAFSFFDITRLSPCSITCFFCSRDGNA